MDDEKELRRWALEEANRTLARVGYVGSDPVEVVVLRVAEAFEKYVSGK